MTSRQLVSSGAAWVSRWEQVGRVHGEVFGQVRPASTMVEVSRLIDPALHVEVEADAVVP